ncbi:hypothetical protein NPIL_156661 [Nephila pilipes]|uniref:Uncharacterized protein n=1 Tax=Nephila pilipes TaxID=299642 RepID=A0A8X6T3C0_NEPPI|nr:hypothetical protein NPIL_156661 [Nephila pilipes]
MEEWCRARMKGTGTQISHASVPPMIITKYKCGVRSGDRSNLAAIVELPTKRQHDLGIMIWRAIAYNSGAPLVRIQGTMMT